MDFSARVDINRKWNTIELGKWWLHYSFLNRENENIKKKLKNCLSSQWWRNLEIDSTYRPQVYHIIFKQSHTVPLLIHEPRHLSDIQTRLHIYRIPARVSDEKDTFVYYYFLCLPLIDNLLKKKLSFQQINHKS